MKFQHIDPADAVQVHQDIKAKKSFGIHWGTFKMMSNEVSCFCIVDSK